MFAYKLYFKYRRRKIYYISISCQKERYQVLLNYFSTNFNLNIYQLCRGSCKRVILLRSYWSYNIHIHMENVFFSYTSNIHHKLYMNDMSTKLKTLYCCCLLAYQLNFKITICVFQSFYSTIISCTHYICTLTFQLL